MAADDSKKILETIQSMDDSLDDENFVEFYDSEFDNMQIIASERTTAWGWIK